MKRDLLLLAVALVIAAILFVKRKSVLPKIKTWFFEPMYPLTLAIFRIVVFAVLLVTVNGADIDFFATLPKSFQYPPVGLLGVELPFSLPATHAIHLLFQIACILAMIGFFSKTSAAVTTVTAIYLLALPNLYGKVNHAHHLVWFALLLAFSRAGDILSIDGIFKAWKRADRDDISHIGPDPAYGVPLKFAILLMGLMYFFPGFYKLYNVGPSWLKPDNLRMMMHNDWFSMGEWLPPIRLDQNSLLLVAGGLFTIFFELFFLPLAAMRRTRPVAAVFGIMFHNATYISLGIRFGTLQAMYVALIDWHKVFTWLGRKLYPTPVYMLYDDTCRFCKRAIASIKTFDVFQRFETLPVNGRAEWPKEIVEAPEREVLVTDIHCFTRRGFRVGIDTYASVLSRVPLLWFMVPFLVVPGLKSLSGAGYRWIADNRDRLIGEMKQPPKPRPASKFWVMPMGVLLILGNLIFGAKHWVNAWPLACYPPYDFAATDTSHSLEVLDGNGARHRPIMDPYLREKFQPNRLNALLHKIRTDESSRQAAQLQDLLALWRQHAALKGPVTVWDVERFNSPERWKEAPKAEKALATVP